MSAKITQIAARAIPLNEDLFVIANDAENLNFSLSLLNLKNAVDAIPRDTLVDEVSSVLIYVGKAFRGSLASASVWKIKKVDLSVDPPVVTYPNGSRRFAYIWNNRATYTYSEG